MKFDSVSLLNCYWESSEQERQRDYKSTKWVAALLRMTESRVRQLVDEGRIPAIKLFGRILIHEPTLRAILEHSQE